MSISKPVSLKKSVFELCTMYPELVSTLVRIGFKDIAKPGMLQTAGRIMTLEKGATLKKIEIKQIIEALKNDGYTIEEDSHE